MKGVGQPPIQVLMNVDVSMEVDTGAAVSVMSEKQCKHCGQFPSLRLGKGSGYARLSRCRIKLSRGREEVHSCERDLFFSKP